MLYLLCIITWLHSRENREAMPGMRTIKKKLNSQRGASLTFALLLFLVCAVVGSVVLVAGTAASGRLAGLADYEQRFYAVNSAAELLAEEITFGKTTVTMTRTETEAGIIRTTLADGSIPTETEGTKSTAFLLTNNSPVSCIAIPKSGSFHGSTKSILESLAKKMVIKDEEDPEASWNNLPDTFEATAYTISTDGKPGLTVNISAQLAINKDHDKKGNLTLTIENKTGNDKYRIIMDFKTEEKLSWEAKPTNPIPEDTITDTEPVERDTTMTVVDPETNEERTETGKEVVGVKEKITRTITQTKTQGVKWKLESITVLDKEADT